MLTLRNLRAAYAGRAVLHGIDLRVAGGEVVHIVGGNGAGKSTLFRAICGLTPANSDELVLAQTSLQPLSPERRFACGIGFMPQGHRVFSSLTVGENVRLAARVRGVRPWLIDELRLRLSILDRRFDQRAGTLSGGETQIVLLARTLVGNPRVALLDEPAEGLDADSLGLVLSLIAGCAERGSAVIIAEQRTDSLRGVATSVHQLVDGRLQPR